MRGGGCKDRLATLMYRFWDHNEEYIAVPAASYLADRMKNMLKIMDGAWMVPLSLSRFIKCHQQVLVCLARWEYPGTGLWRAARPIHVRCTRAMSSLLHADICVCMHTSPTEQWFLERLQELAETEQRNRATFNRAVSAVTSTSRCSSIANRANAVAPAAVDSTGERGLQRLATGVMTGMGTLAGGMAVTVGGVATSVTAVTDGVAKLLQPGKKDTPATADE